MAHDDEEGLSAGVRISGELILMLFNFYGQPCNKVGINRQNVHKLTMK